MMVFIPLIILLLFLAGLPLFNILRWKFSGPSPSKRIILVGHRGAAGLAPENTLPAFDTGISYHMDLVETDIRQTADGHIVIMHDRTVNRTTDGKGAIDKMTYAALQHFNASRSFPGYKNVTRIPLLSEVLEKVKTTGSRLLIEIKEFHLYPDLVPHLVTTIKETGSENNVAVFSFDEKPLALIKQQLPGVTTGLFSVGYKVPLPGLKVDYVCPNWITLLYFPSVVESIHKKGLHILVWTVDSPFWMRYLIAKKVDGIISDRPDLLAALNN
jgi:glycerophosphoryl diester phosphodiesterase